MKNLLHRSLPSFIHKLLVIFVKLPLMKTLDFLNLFYKQPSFKMELTDSDMGILEKKFSDETRFDDNGLYIYKQFPNGMIDNGDQCFHNGIFSAYLTFKHRIQNKSTLFLHNYLRKFIVKTRACNITLLRGVPLRDDASGDQLVDMTLAVNEYLKKGGDIETIRPYKDLINDLCKSYKLSNLDGTPTRHGKMNPSVLLIGKKISTICAALLVAGKSEEFDYLWNKCGYKYLICHTDPYLWNGKYTYLFNKKVKIDKRDWFGSRIAGINLAIIYDHMYKRSDKKRVKKALMKILKRDKWNTWIWLLAVDYNIITPKDVPEETLNYFRTFKVKEFGIPSKLFPLGGQNTDFVWQRSPFKKDWINAYVGKVDFLYAYELYKRYFKIKEKD